MRYNENNRITNNLKHDFYIFVRKKISERNKYKNLFKKSNGTGMRQSTKGEFER